jgi:hypothetical protein
MPDYFPTFQDDLKNAVKDTWGLTDASVFTSMQALRNNVVNEIAAGDNGDESDLAVPYAVVMLGKEDADDTWGLTAQAKRAPVAIWFIDRLTDRDNQAAVHAKLYALAQAMRVGPYSFQEVEGWQIDSGTTNPANAEFLENGVKLIAGSVSWPNGLLHGEIADA